MNSNSVGEVQRILAVDDSRTNRLILESVLGESHDLLTTGSAEEAMILAGEFEPDIFLVDWILPGMSGLDLCRHFKGMADFADVPVIMVTAMRDEDSITRALEAGATDYVTKPYSAAELTARVRSSLRLGETVRTLRRLNREKNFILGIAAHDLRNPVSIVSMYASYLLSGGHGRLTPEQESMVSTMLRSSDFMLGLLEDILDLASFESGEITLRRSVFDFRECIVEDMALQQVIGSRKGVTLKADLPEYLPWVSADRGKMAQVLSNLLSNAVKFSPPGSAVMVSAGFDDGVIRVEVGDQGPGVPAHERENLFQPFRVASSKPTAGEKSTGLGLAIVRRIVEAHGGRIWIDETPAGGALFVFTLPAGPQEG